LALQPCFLREAFHIYDFTTTNEPLVWQGSQIHGFSKGLLSPVLNLTATHIKSFGNLGSTHKIIWAILYKKGLVQRTAPVTSEGGSLKKIEKKVLQLTVEQQKSRIFSLFQPSFCFL
jgi:hypothetical protein